MAKKSDASRGKRKSVAPASATGSPGVAFEHRVQAQRLLALCLASTNCSYIPSGFRVVELTFQARPHGHNTDDLVCAVENDFGSPAKVRMQMKRTLSPADSDFEEAVGLAWMDFVSGEFRRDSDRFVIAYDVTSSHTMSGAAEVARVAAGSTSAASWHMKVTAAGVSNDAKRKALLKIQAAVDLYQNAAVPLDELYEFLRHVDFAHHDLDSDTTEAVALQRSLIDIAFHAARLLPIPGELAWSKLVTACVELNGRGGEVSLKNVSTFIGSDLHVRFAAVRQMRLQGPIAIPASTSATAPPAEFLGAGALGQSTEASAEDLRQVDLIPASREASVNKLVSRRLDRINEFIKQERFADALTDVEELAADLEAFDSHQLARWHLMRGTCIWNVHGNTAEAAQAFLTAADICDDEDKLAAARIRGHLLKGETAKALEAGVAASKRFPDSLVVWVTHTNARAISGETISVADIPQTHSSKAVAFQIVATAASQAGDAETALSVSMSALDKEDVSFFIREAALRHCLELATQNPLHAAFRIIPPRLKSQLQRVTREFSPRDTRLWASQSTETSVAAVTNLAFAHLLLNEPMETLAILQEASSRNFDPKGTLLRPMIDALRDLGRDAEAVSLARMHLATMSADTFITFGHAAANEPDDSAIAEAMAAAKSRMDLGDRQEDVLAVLGVLRWDLLIRTGRAEAVRGECVLANVLTDNRIERVVVAARAFLRSPKKSEVEPYIGRARELATNSQESGAKYLFAKLLQEARRYREAAEVLAPLIEAGSLSELHIDLLNCYIKSGQRKKAEELLAVLPQGWAANEQARSMAMDLGQRAGDWVLLASLVEPQLAAEPLAAKSWLFKLMVAARDGHAAEAAVVASLPEVLAGSIREIAQLASAELEFGRMESGLRRLYRLRRRDMGSVEAATAHFIALVPADEGLSQLPKQLSEVTEGSSVCLVDADGVKRWRTIDPPGMEDLTPTEEFSNASSHEGKALLGLGLGDDYVVKDMTGRESTFRVESIIPAHRRIAMLAGETLNSPLVASTAIGRVDFQKGADGQLDLSPMVKQLEKSAARAEKVFGIYRDESVTLGGLARMLSVDVIDLVRGWPRSSSLKTGGGGREERDAAAEALSKARRCVIDLAALVELGMVGQLGLLGALPGLMVTTATLDQLERKIAEVSRLRASGEMSLQNGQLVFRRLSADDRTVELAFLGRIRDAVKAYAQVVPAYGPLEVNQVLIDLGQMLSSEEHAALLAAAEHGALLFSLDERLRTFAAVFGVVGLWPQIFLMTQRRIGLSQLDYSMAAGRMLLTRRTFISLDATDLMLMTEQGTSYFNHVFNDLRAHLEDSEVDFQSAASVVLEYLARLFNRGACQFGVILELFSHLLESLLRHDKCPIDFVASAPEELAEELGTKEKAVFRRALVRCANLSLQRRERARRDVVLKMKVLYCGRVPLLLSGLGEEEDPLTSLRDQEQAQPQARKHAASRGTEANPRQ
jgi:tetratricopeptide (TPR) repeat protein